MNRAEKSKALHAQAIALAARAIDLARNLREGTRELDALDAAVCVTALESMAASIHRAEAGRPARKDAP